MFLYHLELPQWIRLWLSGCWIQAFLLIFFSEIGDKTFFIAVFSSICFVCLNAVKFSLLDIKIRENLNQKKNEDVHL